MAEKGGRVAGRGEDRCNGQLGRVVRAGKLGRVHPEVHLKRGVGSFNAHVVADQLQRIDARDANLDRAMSYLPQAVVERRVARQVGERLGTQVGLLQGGQDADETGRPPNALAVSATRSSRMVIHGSVRRMGSRRAAPVGVQLQVEAIQLHGDPGSADAARTAWLRGRGRPA